MIDIIMSEHGIERLRQRVQRKVSKRTLSLAIERGLQKHQLSGRLQNYVLSRSGDDKTCYVYQGKIFIFRDNIFITVIILPRLLRSDELKAIRKRNTLHIACQDE